MLVLVLSSLSIIVCSLCWCCIDNVESTKIRSSETPALHNHFRRKQLFASSLQQQQQSSLLSLQTKSVYISFTNHQDPNGKNPKYINTNNNHRDDGIKNNRYVVAFLQHHPKNRNNRGRYVDRPNTVVRWFEKSISTHQHSGDGTKVHYHSRIRKMPYRIRQHFVLWSSTTSQSIDNNNNNTSTVETMSVDDEKDNIRGTTGSYGLYRPFAEYAWKILESIPNLEQVPVPDEWSTNSVVAPGKPNGTTYTTRITIRALTCCNNVTTTSSYPIRYARYALLETIPNVEEEIGSTTTIRNPSVDGIQVLNMVIFPTADSTLPVWGADFVSLPGNKHLVLLDAQPMGNDRTYSGCFDEWYKTNNIATIFPWGGTIPEPVQPYVSSNALWTRFVQDEGNDAPLSSSSTTSPIELIQGPLYVACQQHLQIYLNLLQNYSTVTTSPSTLTPPTTNQQLSYLQYRIANDPARPMLNRLYGKEWTEQVLQNVLFPTVTE